MGFDPGKGWEKKSDSLFIHDNGTRISKTAYRGKPGWWILPVDLDAPPIEYPATDAGRDEAFAVFAKGLPKPKPKPKPKEDPKKKKIQIPDEEGEEGDEPKEPPPVEDGIVPEKVEANEDEDEDEDEDDEKEEKPEKDAAD